MTTVSENGHRRKTDADWNPEADLENNDKKKIVDFAFDGATTTSGQRRSNSIEGMTWGGMVGEALASGRADLDRRTHIAVYGRPPLRYSVILGRGYPGRYFHLCLVAAQSVLRSRSNCDAFTREFLRRRKWYLVSHPLRSVYCRFSRQTDLFDRQTDLMCLAVYITTLLQGSGASASRWLQSIAEKSESESALPAAQLLAKAAQIAILDRRATSHPSAVWDELKCFSRDTNLIETMQKMDSSFVKGRSVYRAALSMGWGEKIPKDPNAVACLSIYSWLRHPAHFRFIVERAIVSTGGTTAVGTLAGSLAGISLGLSNIPSTWISEIQSAPYDREFLGKMCRRLTDWPHGVDDLHSAPAFPIYPVRQAVRNAGLGISKFVNALIRQPHIAFARYKASKKKK
jgi:ADP-ribosyl-[dinitrogen reductase] hydrolase